MTDTGQNPEGPRPEPVDVPVPAAYTFPGHADEAGDSEEEDLLMPGVSGAWGDAAMTPRPTVPQPTPVRPLAERAAPVPTHTEPEYLDIPADEPPAEPVAVEVVPVPAQPVAPEAVPEPVPAPEAVLILAQAAVPAEETPAVTPPAGPVAAPEAESTSPLPVTSGAWTAPQPPAEPAEVPVASDPVVPEPVAPERVVPEPVVPEPVVPGAVAPEAVAPGAVAPEAVAPGAVVPEPVALEPVAPERVVPEPVVPEPVVPGAVVPEPVAPGAVVPERVVPEAVAPEPVVPEPVVPEPVVPEPVVPEAAVPEAVVPEAAVPEAVAPGAVAPGAVAPGAVVPGAVAPEPVVPGAVAPEVAVPEPAVAEPVTVAERSPEEPAAPVDAALRPPAPGYPDTERETVHRLMRERRDIRNGFRSDPIPHEVLIRVLEAAHTAPSVGLSQPWDFVLVRSPETRAMVHELAAQQRDAYAKSLPKARAKQFKELKVEAILETPVNIVVTADPTRGGRHTLGRHTQPQMAPYSSALAVENLWLAARAEGLGVGWVSFFDERELARALDLPEHLEVVAYLCVGYVDEFPGEPELARHGWSRRRPLSWVVHEEAYGRRALPGAGPHDLLSETLAEIRPLDAQALGEAWERQKRMTKPAGALGALEVISAQLCGLSRSCPPPVPEPAAVAVFAGDHGVHAQGVTPWPQEVTAQMVANFLGGGAVCNAFATQVGAEVCVIDVGVKSDLPGTPGLLPRKIRPGTADFTVGPAMSREEAMRAIEVGIETARDLVAAGNRALLTGEMGIANTTVAAALIAVFADAEPTEVTGRGTGIDDETHTRKVEVVRRALQRHQPDPGDPIGVLAAVGGLEHAALAGLILGGASLRVPVILDGVSAGAAALAARAIAPEAVSVCIAGHRSAEPGHLAALTALGLRPLVDLDLRLGEGTGALLALPVVQSAARAMREVATFDSAGVTDKN
ncbi:nicotinate-nucleotide--dimethylbenzimidazole phosphoribosyltransferase [Streptomyces sp. NBC_01803]|nr:nicotinate-nucleotide--dimethylbenzimidazole phosphoribosyltransferase [Streptomyces sp. NBC_01803]WSA47120.1 nicotinate-nucleotide--dimethylbenzimidazole phosphoribosyltransferase [Streptomyces sp. NBC_01803]